jgi:hypothetical protein
VGEVLRVLDAQAAPHAPRVEDLLVGGSAYGVKRVRVVRGCGDRCGGHRVEKAMAAAQPQPLAQEWPATDETCGTSSDAGLLTHTLSATRLLRRRRRRLVCACAGCVTAGG